MKYILKVLTVSLALLTLVSLGGIGSETTLLQGVGQALLFSIITYKTHWLIEKMSKRKRAISTRNTYSSQQIHIK